jgi:hypothetical protein
MPKKDGVMSVCAVCSRDFYIPPSHRDKRMTCSYSCKSKLQSEWQRQDLAKRFWAKVDKSGDCWLWTGAILKTGYGSIRIDHKAIRAHRAAYELSVGPIPAGALLRHTCDNPRCVNPTHLLLGNKRSNTQDAIERGQHRCGERDPKAKLTNQNVIEIRDALARGETGRALARRFGVGESAISQIKTGKSRRHG